MPKSILAFYLNGGVREVIPIYPLYAIMFASYGVTPLELSTLFVIWAMTGLLFEVPSGAWADRYSRKWLIVASGMLKSAGFGTWYMSRDFTGFALGFVLWGLGSTLRSGAWEALLYDLLHQAGQTGAFTRHHGRIKALGTTGVLIGEMGGAVLILNGYDIVLLVSAAVPIIATLPFVFFVQEPGRTRLEETGSYFTTLRAGLAETARNPAVRLIALVTGLVLVVFGVYDEYVPPTFAAKEFDLSLVALLCAPVYLAQAIGHAAAERFAGASTTALLAGTAAFASPLLLLPVLPPVETVGAVIIVFFAFGAGQTLFQARLQAVISGEARATVTSVVGLADSLGAMLWFFVVGILASRFDITGAAAGLGIGAIGLCIVLSVLARVWRVR